MLSCKLNIQWPLQITSFLFPRAFVASTFKCTKPLDTKMNAHHKVSYDINASAGGFFGVFRIEIPLGREEHKDDDF